MLISLSQHKNKLTFRRKVFLLLFSIFSLFLLIFAAFVYFFDSALLKEQYSLRALEQARLIASMQPVSDAVIERDEEGLEKLVKKIQRHSDSSFISIADKNGIRLYHPESSLIGKPITGLKDHKILKDGKFYLSASQGSMGMSVRGMKAILGDKNQIVGVVAVVYLIERVNLFSYIPLFALVLAIGVGIAITSSVYFSRHIQKQMFYMEPEEIGLSYQFQNSIMDAVNEGIIVFNNDNKVQRFNMQALTLLNATHHEDNIKNLSVETSIMPADFILSTSLDNISDAPIVINGINMIASRIVIIEKNKIIAKVVSFRKEDEIYALSQELTQVQQYVDNLRVVKHEYANKLATISGLLELRQYKKIQDIIRLENQERQVYVDFIRKHILNDHIAGLLIGKCARAAELGCALHFDPSSLFLSDKLPLTENELVAILGNLIDNAFEACLKADSTEKEVLLFIRNDGNELLIEVSDSGIGIKEEEIESIFKKGITSKNESGHGIGLYLVRQFVSKVGGEIIVDQNKPHGTIFSVFIPNT